MAHDSLLFLYISCFKQHKNLEKKVIFNFSVRSRRWAASDERWPKGCRTSKSGRLRWEKNYRLLHVVIHLHTLMDDSNFKKPVNFREQRLLRNASTSQNGARLAPIKPPGNLGVPRAGGYRNKVALKPGHSALDWHELTSTKGKRQGLVTRANELLQNDLEHLRRTNYAPTLSQLSRNVPLYLIRPPLRIDKQLLQKHNTKDDCWCVINGKVYCLTSYLDFHPGGVDILLKNCAGKDATIMFDKYHRWVSYDKLLETCFVGIYVE